jgi:hypothetical protein
MQTFLGSVKKPAFAKAAARQTQRLVDDLFRYANVLRLREES